MLLEAGLRNHNASASWQLADFFLKMVTSEVSEIQFLSAHDRIRGLGSPTPNPVRSPWSPTLVVICIAISLARPGGVGEESLAVLTMPDNSSPADR